MVEGINWKTTQKIHKKRKKYDYNPDEFVNEGLCMELADSEDEPIPDIVDTDDIEKIEDTTLKMTDSDYDCNSEPKQIISAYNAFNIYLRKYPLLTSDEEKELSRRIQSGDKDAYHKLVLSNLRLVIACAGQTLRRYGNDSILDYMDMIMEGVTGLLVAALRFDWKKNTRFSTYAVLWICSRIKRAMESQREGFTVPGYTGKSIHVLNEHIKNYLNGKEDEIPSELKKRVRELSTIAGPVIIIDNACEEDDNTGTISPDYLSDTASDTDEDIILNDIESDGYQKRFHSILKDILTDEEYYIFCRRHGVGFYTSRGPSALRDLAEERFRSIEFTRLQMDGIENLIKNNAKIQALFNEWCCELYSPAKLGICAAAHDSSPR